MRKTKEEAEQTKKEILSAALIVFEEKSYDTATLSDIAKKAGVTRGAIYWHFENKFDILKDLAYKYLGEFFKKIFEDLSEKDVSPCEKIKCLYEDYFTFVSKSPEMIKFRRIIEFKIAYTKDTRLIDELFTEGKEKIHEKILELIKAGQENNEIRKDMSNHFLTVSLIAWMVGYENMMLCERDISNLSLRKEEFIENVIKFIKA